MHDEQVPRAKSASGFLRVSRSPSFFIPPETYRSASAQVMAGWQDTPYPRTHRGYLGGILDFCVAVYHETPLLAALVSRLIRYIGVGVKAYVMLLRLVCFAIFLSPAIAKAVVWWWKSPNISRGIQYGSNARNFLDIYHAIDTYTFSMDSDSPKRPVVVYLTGGAWIIGYKAWAAPLGEYLSKHGILTVSVDYRNFPQGTLNDMQEDASAALDWVWNNISNFGGDRERIFVVGQSAGAHILSQLMIKKANESSTTVGRVDSTAEASSVSFPLCKWRMFIGVSGPYDIVSLTPTLIRRGLNRRIINSIMDNDLFGSSPVRQLTSMKPECVNNLPPILLLHGTKDASVPVASAVGFFEALRKLGVGQGVEMELWPGVTHSEPIVEGPAGGNNFFGSRVVEAVTGLEGTVKSQPLMNTGMIDLAKLMMPF